MDGRIVRSQFDVRKYKPEEVGAGKGDAESMFSEVEDETKVTEEVKTEQKLPDIASIHSMSVTTLKVISFVISMVATVMSVYYSFDWFRISLGFFGATAMSLIIVSCISLSPQFIIVLLKKKTGPAIAAAIIIALMDIPATMFSMGTTVGGLYNKRSRTIAESSVGSSKVESLALARESAKAKIERLKADIENAKKEEESYTAKYLEAAVGGRTEGLLGPRIENVRKRITSKEAELDKAIAELDGLRDGPTVERDDFYTWIAERLGRSVGSVELVLLSFPAVFIDVIAPTMLAVALFL